MEKEKILIGASISSLRSMLLPEFIKGLKEIDWENKKIVALEHGPDKSFLEFLQNVKGIEFKKTDFNEEEIECIVNDRNQLKQLALGGGFDFYLNVNEGVVPPKNVLKKLVANNKKICSGVSFEPKAFQKIDEEKFLHAQMANVFRIEKMGENKHRVSPLNLNQVFPSRLLKADAFSLDCTLIHKSVLKEIDFAHKGSLYSEALDFCLKAKEKKFELFADSSIVCKNLQSALIEKRI